MALTSEQRVTKSHIAIMRSKQFCMFAGVLSVGKVMYTEDIPTACTNGRDVIYNKDFIKTLDVILCFRFPVDFFKDTRCYNKSLFFI